MSAEMRNERVIDCAKDPGVGESLLRREGIRLDSAPEVDTLPISSWLKRAMQFTFPSNVGKYCEETLSAKASTAQKLKEWSVLQEHWGVNYPYEDTRLSMRGLKMNSLLIPPRVAG